MDEINKPQNEKEMDVAFPVLKRVNKSLGTDPEQIDLDVTPVMNLFMVLIPFLVSMAVFTHIAVIDFSLPPGDAAGDSQGEHQKTNAKCKQAQCWCKHLEQANDRWASPHPFK